MPNYEFRCVRGCVSDLVRPLGTEQAACPFCGEPAARTHAPSRFDVIGPTVDTRGMFRRWQEATSEIDHGASKIEANTGEPVQTPNFWKQAKQKAAAMVAAGEAPVIQKGA